MSPEQIQQIAINKLNTKPLKDVLRWIDENYHLPDCIQKRLLALVERDRIKQKVNQAASERLTKITGPTLLK